MSGVIEESIGGGAGCLRLLVQTIIASWSHQLSLHRYPRRPLSDIPAGDSDSDFITTDDWHTAFAPSSCFMPRATINANVITVALGSLQPLNALRAVCLSAIPSTRPFYYPSNE